MKNTLLIAVMTSLITLSSTALAESSKDIIAKAEEAQKKAAAVGGEWRDVGKFIKKAKEALKDGDKKKAKKLAEKALQQSEDGYTQAINQVEKAKDFPSYLK